MSMTDDPFYRPGQNLPPQRQPQPGEVLFEFVRESDHEHFRCELGTHGGEWGVEAQFFVRGDLFIARRFDTRALAVQWASIEREHIEKGLD
jgi:hypothetical protein